MFGTKSSKRATSRSKRRRRYRIKKKRIGMKAHWQEMASMMYGLGNNNKVLEGVIENYLILGFSDPMFPICSETAQWIECFDRLKHLVGAKQHWSLMAYL